jgi:peptidoglycan/LPS O-acetylase OafA/YrhL
LGLACVAVGLIAMLSARGRGRHPRFGTIYLWCLAALFATSAALAAVRWRQDWPLFVLGAFAFGAALVGRTAAHRRRCRWARWHISGMGGSYILLLTAFYVDNGKNLPLWRSLPPLVSWIAPAAVGLPIMLWALARHPLIRRGEGSG